MRITRWIPHSALSGSIHATCDPNFAIHQVWYPFLFVLLIVSWNILLNAARSQWAGDLVISALGFLVYWSLTTKLELENDLASASAALVVGLAANAWDRITHQPSVTLIISGVLLMVPGGLGVKSIEAMMMNDALSGISFAFK